jgi:hypothetical protein
MGFLRLVPYAAITIGLVLNFTGVRRPDLGKLINYMVYADVAIFSFAIGTIFRLGSVRRFLRECLAMSAIKFIVSPIVGLALFFLMSQFLDLSGLLLQVTVIQCAMPVAIMSVVVSRFCHLDMQLASAVWVFTTLAVAAVVPVLAVIVPLLG